MDDAAYAELFGWYLGDGHITRQRRGVFGLHIVNDERYPELVACCRCPGVTPSLGWTS